MVLLCPRHVAPGFGCRARVCGLGLLGWYLCAAWRGFIGGVTSESSLRPRFRWRTVLEALLLALAGWTLAPRTSPMLRAAGAPVTLGGAPLLLASAYMKQPPEEVKEARESG